MCGICGVATRDGAPVDESLLLAMTRAIQHRGPDDEGTYLFPGVGLGFRRLSIVDLAAGHQPMTNETGDLWVIFNGEIYNHRELRDDLVKKGHVFRTSSDTETILHLFEEEGNNAFAKLNGMFAIALWDERAKRLTIARDRLGIKPLHYFASGSDLVFASEVKALLLHPAVPRALNVESLREFLIFRSASGESSLYRDIKNLLPGHLMVWENGTLKIEQYWDVTLQGGITPQQERTAEHELAHLVRDSISLQLMADVPVGTLLSGGIDSSVVTALAAQASSGFLSSFSIGFAEEAFNELHYARMVAKRCQTRQHELVVSNLEFSSALPEMIYYLDEPLNHANSVQIYYISAFARSEVKVLLTGEGADEIFGGYPRYFVPTLLRPWLWVPRPIRKAMGSVLRRSSNHRARKIGDNLPRTAEELLIYNSAFAHPHTIHGLLNADVPESSLSYRYAALRAPVLRHATTLQRLSYLELKTYLVSILNRMDKMTMAAGIEARVPFLDHRIVEWGFNLPDSLKLHRAGNKWLLKQVAAALLPREVVTRKKSGFGVPVGAWFQDPHGLGRYLDLLGERAFRERGYFDIAKIDQIVDDHRRGKHDHGELLWELVNLELWHKIAIDQTVNPAQSGR